MYFSHSLYDPAFDLEPLQKGDDSLLFLQRNLPLSKRIVSILDNPEDPLYDAAKKVNEVYEYSKSYFSDFSHRWFSQINHAGGVNEHMFIMEKKMRLFIPQRAIDAYAELNQLFLLVGGHQHLWIELGSKIMLPQLLKDQQNISYVFENREGKWKEEAFIFGVSDQPREKRSSYKF